jgi:hypothetical protein
MGKVQDAYERGFMAGMARAQAQRDIETWHSKCRSVPHICRDRPVDADIDKWFADHGYVKGKPFNHPMPRTWADLTKAREPEPQVRQAFGTGSMFEEVVDLKLSSFEEWANATIPPKPKYDTTGKSFVGLDGKPLPSEPKRETVETTIEAVPRDTDWPADAACFRMPITDAQADAIIGAHCDGAGEHDGRSGWYLVRTVDGSLMLACYPHGGTYIETEAYRGSL